MKSKVSTEWSTISHPSRRARLSGNNSKKLFLDNHSVGFIIASKII